MHATVLRRKKLIIVPPDEISRNKPQNRALFKNAINTAWGCPVVDTCHLTYALSIHINRPAQAMLGSNLNPKWRQISSLLSRGLHCEYGIPYPNLRSKENLMWNAINWSLQKRHLQRSFPHKYEDVSTDCGISLARPSTPTSAKTELIYQRVAHCLKPITFKLVPIWLGNHCKHIR